ncbi:MULTISPECIES: hypothetical protein [unclassified Pseudomonas]|nr:hypothetical protein [Pseudomonas sp. M47T1]
MERLGNTLVARTAEVSVNLSLGYSRSLDANDQQALGGTVGVRVSG